MSQKYLLLIFGCGIIIRTRNKHNMLWSKRFCTTIYGIWCSGFLISKTVNMPPVDSKFIQGLHLGQKEEGNFVYNTEGLRFIRKFSVEGKNPFDLVEYEKRSSVIREPDGTVVFEMK